MYVSTRLGRWFYEERGTKRRESDATIVLWHSFLCDGGMWDGQIDALAKIGHVIVFDGPGHGKSEPPPPFTLDDNTRALVDALDTIAKGPVVMAGLSWGGMVGMRLALQHPAKVAGLALLDTSAEKQSLAERLRYRAFIAIHRRVGIPYGMFLKEVAPLMFAARTLADRPDLALTAYRRSMGFDREGVCRASLAVVVRRTNILDKLDRIGTPTLVMCGREDGATPPAMSENIARGIRGSRLVMLDDVGHMSALEDPDAVNQHLVPFARSIVCA